MNEWMNEKTDGRTDGRMDGWMDGWKHWIIRGSKALKTTDNPLILD